jgi:hypothetical protein
MSTNAELQAQRQAMRLAILEETLDEVLNHVFGVGGRGWRGALQYFERCSSVKDNAKLDRGATLGDLRRWAAPLLTEG